MKLELYMNGILYNSLEIDQVEFIADVFRFDYRVERNKERVEAHVSQLKAHYFQQICKAKNFEIFLIAESKMK